MANVLEKLKRRSESSHRLPSSEADLKRAIDRADDARDIARDMLRRLPTYTGSEDEDTARHEMREIHTHVHMHSQPDADEPELELGPLKVRKLPRWAVVAIVATGVIAAAATAIASHFAAK